MVLSKFVMSSLIVYKVTHGKRKLTSTHDLLFQLFYVVRSVGSPLLHNSTLSSRNILPTAQKVGILKRKKKTQMCLETWISILPSFSLYYRKACVEIPVDEEFVPAYVVCLPAN